jgi:hypothetical protein
MKLPKLLRLLAASTLAMAAMAQTLDGPTRFLVKLRTDIGARKSKAGDPVTAFVISPERFLAASFEGTVDEAADGRLRFTFTKLTNKGKSVEVASTILEFVNSKGHKRVDESERPMDLDSGALKSATPDFTLDEGAEFELEITPRR